MLQVLGQVLAKTGPVPVLLERDQNIPTLEGLLAEAPGEPPDSLSLGWLQIELEQQRSLLARLGALLEGHEAHSADSPASN